jgi:hypothetical protein
LASLQKALSSYTTIYSRGLKWIWSTQRRKTQLIRDGRDGHTHFSLWDLVSFPLEINHLLQKAMILVFKKAWRH